MCVSRRHCGWFSDLRTLVYGFAAECSSNREFSHCMKIYHSSALLLFSFTSACLFRFNAQVCFCFLYFIKGKPFGSAYREGNLSKSFVAAYAWVIADRLRDVESTCDGRYVLLRAHLYNEPQTYHSIFVCHRPLRSSIFYEIYFHWFTSIKVLPNQFFSRPYSWSKIAWA